MNRKQKTLKGFGKYVKNSLKILFYVSVALLHLLILGNNNDIFQTFLTILVII